MTLPSRAAVIGLGLMGGSLARDLASLGVEVLGHDRDAGAVGAALSSGVLRGALPPSLEGAEAADLLVLAVPVSAAEAILETLAPRLAPGCVVTDLGSTKRSIAGAAERLGLGGRFVGSHPLAGDHRSGWEASRPGLFAGARVFVCPAEGAAPSAREAVRELWLRLGARPEEVDPAEHDRRLAWSSHLPQAASSALARSLAAAGIPRGELGPGGRDVTRLAGSSPEMWTAVCLDNAEAMDQALGALLEELAGFREALRERDADRLFRLFDAARAWSGERPENG